jgi:hypothetical protein
MLPSGSDRALLIDRQDQRRNESAARREFFERLRHLFLARARGQRDASCRSAIAVTLVVLDQSGPQRTHGRTLQATVERRHGFIAGGVGIDTKSTD